MKNYLLIFIYMCLAPLANAQQAMAEFAGISVSASPSSLAAAGFVCMPRGGNISQVDCIDGNYRGEMYGIQVVRREALFLGQQLASVRVLSASQQNPGYAMQSLIANIGLKYQQTGVIPRMMAGIDNSDRRFWKVSDFCTLSMSMTPVPNGTGGGYIRFAMIMPAAH